MRIDDWTTFLRTWSAERFAVREAGEQPAESEWLGFEPATEDEIVALERRLGLPLPPSYRAFLAVTNGWRWAGEFVSLLCTTQEAGLFRDLSRDTYEMLDEFEQEDLDDNEAPDDEATHRAGRWSRAVQVSLEGDMTEFVLDPGDVDAAGEWAAYRYSSWSDGPVRHDSFAGLMYAEFQSFHHLRNPENLTTRRLDAQIEAARLDLLAGRLNSAVAALEDAAGFGRRRAGLYLFQIRVLLGRWYMLPKVRSLLSVGDPFLESAVLPVLAMLTEQEAHGHDTQDAGLEVYRQRIQDGTFQPLTGEAADRARELATWGDHEDAWRVLSTEVLPRWRPASDSHVVPIELLADPFLGPLITPQRAEVLLNTPRPGGAAALTVAQPAEDGIGWLLDHLQGGPYCVTFARGTDAKELARRTGADPGAVVPPPFTSRGLMRSLIHERERGVVRAGSGGNGWSFTIENNTDRMDAHDEPILGLTLWQQHPSSPVHCAYVDEEGRSVWMLTVTATSGPTVEGGLERAGTRPGLLDEALTAAGALDAEGRFVDIQDRWRDGRTMGRRTLKAVEQYFGLSLPRHLVEHQRLPVLYVPRRRRPEPPGPTLRIELRSRS